MTVIRFVAACAVGAALLCGAAGLAGADVLELNDGTRYEGTLVRRTDTEVRFRIRFKSGGSVETTFPAGRVRSVELGAVARAKPDTKPMPEPKRTPEPDAESVPARRTPAELAAVINSVGSSKPKWWEEVRLDFPKTLDLSGARKTKGPRHNLGSYRWSVLNQDPAKWRPAVKLFHHVVEVRKDDAERQAQAMAMLASAYRDYFNDWARAAYWWRRSLKAQRVASLGSLVGLAQCYAKLGSTSSAVALLKKFSLHTRSHPSSMKLWGELGETRLVLRQAVQRAKQGRADEGYLLAGSACRFAGDYDGAVEYYGKVLAVSKGSRRLVRNKQRAQACAEGAKALQRLDLGRVPDGAYRGSSRGFKSEVQVEVTVKDKRIESVKVIRENESPWFRDRAMRDVPPLIVARQGAKGVDAVTGATMTSDAILNATAKALAGGMK